MKISMFTIWSKGEDNNGYKEIRFWHDETAALGCQR